ncbi:MAG: cupin domain-containing protein [Desulfohalobiaceae bacterium]|nr:cupin domain-containing protein [Desulfohalobiaceae bacterium]MCF8104279.1 cupin domain-containing protein [Desulfohalobiaceae bacterium]
MYYINEQEVEGLDLPGRLWKVLVGPEQGRSQNMIFGLVTFSPGSDPGTHKHDHQEEIIYVISGTGKTVVGDQTHTLKPGVTVFTEPGVEHGVKNTGNEPLVLISVFSPPVKPGSYDQK